MKKTIKLNSSLLVQLRNFWFALQLLIVSVSLPVMSFVQMSRVTDNSNATQTENVNHKSARQGSVVDDQHVKTSEAKV
jgi:hypothetical protein